MSLPVPFGKYELMERIATGGMAEVFLARSLGVAGFEKRLAIKRIREEHANDPRFVQAFIREAKLGVHLNHPNIVQVYDLGKVGPDWYIAMEHIHGRDLTRLVKTLRARGERLPIPVCVAIIARACRGLAFAHGRTDATGTPLGLVHRDVSPHNLMLTFDGEVKLVDFGVARLMNTVEGRTFRDGEGRPGGGKYAYMSPEQARGEALDLRTDVFSTGIVLWELIVGHRLFQHPDPQVKLDRVRAAVVPHPAEEGVPIDDALWLILQRALAREREDRFANAAILEEELRAWLIDQPERAGRAEIAAWMAHTFPDAQDRAFAGLDLARVVEDVIHLDGTVAVPEAAPTGAEEHKPVAALCVEFDGLANVSARFEPEIAFRLRFRAIRRVVRVITRLGGTPVRLVDETLWAAFGLPRTGEDDLDRALECAMELARSAVEPRLAVGVHVGEITVSARRRPSPRGDTFSFARRLSDAAELGEVRVSERAMLAREGDFRVRRAADLPSRAGRSPAPAYVLVGRRVGLRTGGRGAWLRRGAELDVIRDALVGLGTGQGAVIGLNGPTGTGKSRLLREIRDRAHRRGLPFYLARCSTWGEDPPLEPFRDLARGVLGLGPGAGRASLGEELPRLAQLGLDTGQVAAVGALLGAEGAPADRNTTWAALARLFEGLSAEGPVVLALEDLHHLRDNERGHLLALLSQTKRWPVLFLYTWRGRVPEALTGLGPVVQLGAFDRDAQDRLVQSLLDAPLVEPQLLELVHRTSEGNPLYLEQVLKYLLSNRRIEVVDGVARLLEGAAASLPAGLAGLVAARIDALDAASKGALQLAAVIGLTFSSAVLAEAAGVSDATPLLADLAHHGLVARTEGGRDDWTFSSDLVREATLRGLAGAQRRAVHRTVAMAIEACYAEDLEPWAEALAGHCAAAGRPLDAARYAHRAGQRAEREQALETARDRYRQGLDALRSVPASPDTFDARTQGEIELLLRLGGVHLLLGESAAGERALQLALDVASDVGAPWVEVRAHAALGKSYLDTGRPALAAAHLAQARELLDPDEDPELELDVLEASAILAFEQGHIAEADALWREALERSRGDGGAMARCYLGLANRPLRKGDPEARTLLDAALAAARQGRDRIQEGRVLNNIGLLHFNEGRFEEAITCFRQALDVREGIGYTRGVVINHHNIGDAWLQLGDWARAHVSFERSRELALEMNWERAVALNDVYLGFLCGLRGDPDGGLARIEAGAEVATRLRDAELPVTSAWLAGRLLIAAGRLEAGRERLLAARAAATAGGLDALGANIDTSLAGG